MNRAWRGWWVLGSYCAVLDTNGLACWGWNYSGSGSQFNPNPVAGLGSVVGKAGATEP